MRILGVDFTSRPSRRKPVTCAVCDRDESTRRLVFRELHEWSDYAGFEAMLQAPGPWIAGLDFPFGQPRRFIENIGWPRSWSGYVSYTGSLSRPAFRQALDDYRAPRAVGDKEHRRWIDVSVGAISPQKLYGVPVGLMYFEGAPRLQRSDVTIPGLKAGDPERVVVEAYPGVLARTLIGRRSYKQDDRRKQTADQALARGEILTALRNGALQASHGVTVDAPDHLIEDPGADTLDALLCAVQAAWAWSRRDADFGRPVQADLLEGWVADPAATGTPGDPVS